ncbi:hypothetical protein SMC26_17595 [Actinomadura fulvescens]|uniref:Thioredoxin domain-containing protein n=1 Tax=Actinomadura fulvescens TaxID=46160 RepID=A0ABP6CD78_9ACTN
MSFQTTALTLAWVAIAILALGMSGLVRQIRILQGPAAAPADSRPSPGLVGVTAPGLAGVPQSWSKPAVILFATSSCEVCDERLTELATEAAIEGDTLAFFAVYEAPPREQPAVTITTLVDEAAFDAYEIPITPFGVVVGMDGVIREARRVGSQQAIERLIDTAKKVNHDASA